MTSFNLQYHNETQASFFSTCMTPLGTTKEEQDAYFGNLGMAMNNNNPASINTSRTSMSSESGNVLNDSFQLFRTSNRQPQHEQLRKTEEETKKLDALLAQSMAELTFQERQLQQEVLHGVATEVEEDENKIESWLQQLDYSLQERISRSPGDSKHSSYIHAYEMNPSYVQNRELRLMFLRGNQYDPESAADQMIRFFSSKEGLFGREKLCKDITLQDMDEDDRSAIVSGVLQILGTDQAGRQIMLEFTSIRAKLPSKKSELRARFYLFMQVLKDNPSNQVKGVVIIVYGVDQFQDQSGGKGFVENASLALSLPIQLSGIHLCISNPAQYVFSSGALRLCPAKLRARFKVHLGSHLECQYLLSTYGIPIENLPLMHQTNEARMDYHWQWYRERFMKECCNSEEGHALLPKFLWNLPHIPRPTDVLFHRKKSNNGGNQKLRALTRHLLQSYNNGNKGVKRELVDFMINDIKNSGGRFLKADGADLLLQEADESITWALADDSEIREKISQMFRNHRRPNVQQLQELQQQQQLRELGASSPSQNLSGGSVASSESNHPPSPLTSPFPSIPQDSMLHDGHHDADVLFGRKRNNAGNKLVRKLVGDLSSEYEDANRARKLEITNAIVDQVHALGGRFLRKADNDHWEEVSTDFARAKISKHFRNHRRPQKPKQPPSANGSIVGHSRNSSVASFGLL